MTDCDNKRESPAMYVPRMIPMVAFSVSNSAFLVRVREAVLCPAIPS